MFECFDGIKNFFEEAALSAQTGIAEIAYSCYDGGNNSTDENNTDKKTDNTDKAKTVSPDVSKSKYSGRFRNISRLRENSNELPSYLQWMVRIPSEDKKDQLLKKIRAEIEKKLGAEDTNIFIKELSKLDYEELEKITKSDEMDRKDGIEIMKKISLPLALIMKMSEMYDSEKKAAAKAKEERAKKIRDEKEKREKTKERIRKEMEARVRKEVEAEIRKEMQNNSDSGSGSHALVVIEEEKSDKAEDTKQPEKAKSSTSSSRRTKKTVKSQQQVTNNDDDAEQIRKLAESAKLGDSVPA